MAFIRVPDGVDVGDVCQMRQSGTRMNAICIFSHDTTIKCIILQYFTIS